MRLDKDAVKLGQKIPQESQPPRLWKLWSYFPSLFHIKATGGIKREGVITGAGITFFVVP